MKPADYRKQTIIVTGASSGLGEEFARQLARRGSTLVLVARRADRLERLADELTHAHGVTVTVLARDLGRRDAGRTLRADLESRGIYATGLVNNAGFGTHNAFADEDPERLQDMVALNVGALVDLSHAYFEPLASADAGVLINVASLLGLQPTPYLSAYGATKAFVLHFTEGLWAEAQGTRLRVLAVCPGAVDTEFYDAAGSQTADYGAKRLTPEAVVSRALSTLDRRSAPPSVITNGRAIALVTKLLPRRQSVQLMGRLAKR